MMMHPVLSKTRHQQFVGRLQAALMHLRDVDRPEDWARGLALAAEVFAGTAIGPLWAKLLAGTATAAETIEFSISFYAMAIELDAQRFRLQPYIDPDEALAGMTVVAITAASATDKEISPTNIARLALLVEKLATIAGPDHLAMYMAAKAKAGTVAA